MAVTDKQLAELYAKADGTRAFTGNVTLDDAAGPALQNEAASATNPTLLPNKADPDTGVGWESANDLSLITAGLERLRVSNSGNVFAMTTGAQIRGTLNNSGGLINEASSATNPTLLPDRNDETTGIGGTSGGVHVITGGAERLTVDSAGDVNLVSGGFSIGGTEVIDSSRNLTNIVALTVASGAADAIIVLNSDAAQNRDISIQSAGFLRWQYRTEKTAESGSDVGSDFEIRRFDDAGSLLGTPLKIVRASGKVILANELELDGDLNHDGTNVGLYAATPVSQASHIVDADGTLADITTKFNTLLVALDADAGVGLLAGV